MKKIATLLIACLIFQITQAQKINKKHNFHFQNGFAYASDLGYEEEMNRRFQGIGYQYTTTQNWYFGIDAQFHHNELNSNRLLPLLLRGTNDIYTYRLSGSTNEVGYFSLPPSILNTASVQTNSTIFKTGLNQQPSLMQALHASRLNLMLHSGKRWQVGRGLIEAGITFTGTFYSRDVVLPKTQQQIIPLRSLTTGEPFNSIVEVTTYGIENEKTFWAGAGLHARYQYPIKKNISLGTQLLCSMSIEGILLQAAPRLVIEF